MNNLIRRQDVIDAIYEYKKAHEYIKRSRKTLESICLDIKNTVEDLTPANQWIPCSERLPYNQEDVLCDDDGRVTIGYYTDKEIGWHDTHSYRIYPTAWMPLPESWEGEK